MLAILKGMNPKTIYKSQYGLRRVFMMLFSVVLMGFGVSVFSYSDLGVDPYTSMNMALSAKLGVGFGFFQMCMNAVLLVFVVLLSKKLINLGTIANMVGVGYVCQFFTTLYDRYLPVPGTLPVKLCLMLLGVVLLSLSASLYFTSSLGVAPYDATGFILDERSKISYKWCRVITDVICTAIGFAFGGPVGIGTVVTAFFMGPVVTFFNTRVSEKLLRADYSNFLAVRYYDFSRFGGRLISPNGRFAA